MNQTLSPPVVSGLDRAALLDELRRAAEPLPPLDDIERFGRCFDRYGDAHVVLLGEATHGSSEFYRARALITRYLIEAHGFNIVAVEADWPEAARFDAYIRNRQTAFAGWGPARFPSWMWRNREVVEFARWLRTHNAPLAPESRVEFRGLDIYSLSDSIDAVLEYLERIDPSEAARARQRYDCLMPWQSDPASYGLAAFGRTHATCEDEAVAQLHALLAKRLDYMGQDGEAFHDAAQNARIVQAAERYYRIMYQGSTPSWNLRDQHMFDTLERLMTLRPLAKAVVWAHNSHIGNAAATRMGWRGQTNIGELCRKRFNHAAVAIGFGTDRGTVAAASQWDGEMEVMLIRPARYDSYERLFHDTGFAASLTDWRQPERESLRQALTPLMLERAIGVLYRPRTELLSHYFEANLAEQFDAYVWFDQTTAVTPLPTLKDHSAVPDTYPFGL
ncbi:erythromycin esterase family protein [Chitinimonas lacunae]|uniref:Erythromycin esterase family protein n=1 Tax=Chitinimonas lacunae TaxID=1963018 RepID=A0ABV8MNQ1_9NEIS